MPQDYPTNEIEEITERLQEEIVGRRRDAQQTPAQQVPARAQQQPPRSTGQFTPPQQPTGQFAAPQQQATGQFAPPPQPQQQAPDGRSWQARRAAAQQRQQKREVHEGWAELEEVYGKKQDLSPSQELEVARLEAEEQKKASYAGRSLKKAFGGGDGANEADDQINKQMLAPGIKRGTEIDDIIEQIQIVKANLKGPSVEDQKTRTGEHPVFKSTYTQEVDIVPVETPELKEEAKRKFLAREQKRVESDEMLSEFTRNIERKGVLNVKENADDSEFKTFFSDTVVVDSKPMRGRAKQLKGIADVVAAGNEGEAQEIDEFLEPETSEYESAAETELVESSLARAQTGAWLRWLLTLIVAGVSLALTVGSMFEGFLSGNAQLFFILNAALAAALVIVNATAVFPGFARLVSFRANADSLTSFAAIMALVEAGAVLILGADGPARGMTTTVAALALLFSNWGRLTDARRTAQNFKSISQDYEKYATATLADTKFTRRLTRELELEHARILFKRKTGFTEGFLKHARSENRHNKPVFLPASIAFFVALCCGVISYLGDKSVLNAIAAVAYAAAFTAPFAATIANAMPIARMQKQLTRAGAVVPGFSAADELTAGNCVLIEGRELFPKGNVKLHGIKTFEKERIDKAILYAASVLIQSCDTMSNVFMNVIQGKTEMLYEVDSVVYEDGLGFSFWVDKSRVLLGRRELLENHDVNVPSRDYENRYTKKSTRDAIYLSVAGKLFAMFVVSYEPSAEVEQAIRGFMREGISLIVRTRDFNVTPDRIANVYGVPRSMVTVVRESDMIDLGRLTQYRASAPSILTHIGSLPAYAGGILASYKLRSALKAATAVELSGLIVGMLLAAGLALLGSLLGVSVLAIVAFQGVWLLVTALLGLARRY